jgi:uncharacterized phiE125 gp8 family phage protein
LKIVQVTPPSIEPITLSELKVHLRLDSGSLSGNIDTNQSIAPGSHAITVGYALVGSAVNVLGYSAIVNFNAGTNGATGTVDVKIQESEDGLAWTDWSGGAFVQATTANDNAVYEKAYTGAKEWIRAVARVLLAPCEFSVDIVRMNPTVAEDDLLNSFIKTAREQVEDETRRAILTQTHDLYLDEWPCKNFIEIPYGNLQSVTSVKWKDTDGAETTLTEDTDYVVETNGDQHGRIVLPYGGSWPSGSLYPSNPISIRFICGWTEAALVPAKIKSVIKLMCTDLYENREGQMYGQSGQTYQDNKTVMRLLWPMRLW